MKKLLFIILMSLFSTLLFSQEKPEKIIIGNDLDGLDFFNFIKQIEKEHPVKFYFDKDQISNFPVEISNDSIPLIHFLSTILANQKILLSHDAAGNIFLTKGRKLQTSITDNVFGKTSLESDKESQDKEAESEEFARTETEYVAKTITVGTKEKGIKQDRSRLSGYIRNAKSGEVLTNASIYLHELHKGTTTDEEGFYSILIKKGEYTVSVNSIESQEMKFRLRLLSSGELNLELEPETYLLGEVVISSEQNHNVKGTQMGFEKLKTKEIKEIPMVLGEKDIVKVAHLLPGVLSIAEGSASFNVRGSPSDQNLFVINDVPVYNTSHFLGFFSSFNSDAIDEFTMYKSAIPVNYGGRLSSYFDIKASEGRKENFSMRGSISPVTGGFVAEGPVNDKSSYLLGLRSTYSDWVLNFTKDHDIKNSSASFADFIANINLTSNKNNKFNFFAYHSYDKLNIKNLINTSYKNTGTSLSWNHFFKEAQDIKLSLIYSKYHYEQSNSDYDLAAYKQSYDLDHAEIKADYNKRISDDFKVFAGINSRLYQIDKGDILPLNDASIVNRRSFEKEQGLESAIFIGNNWKISKNIELSGGLRFNNYAYLGPKTVYDYRPNSPRIKSNIIDTTNYASGKIIKNYNNLDYRIAAKYLINDDISVKASFNRLHQYIFLLSNTISVSPTDVWKLADSHIQPMTGDQYSAGIYTNIWGGFFELSLEGYYKNVQKLVEYKDGAEFLVNELPETDVLQGKLDAWGLEFMLRKPFGRLNGWLNYTYSNAEVKVVDDITGEANNFGMPYPANYDRPHAFNLVSNYEISKRFSISGTLVYATGRPITYPTSVYFQEGMEVLNYSLRNEYRLPDYFRLDISLKMEGNLLAKKLAHGTFILSVYNLTGRKNAYSVYFKTEDNRLKGYKLSIFGSPIPSITYSFKLGNYEN